MQRSAAGGPFGYRPVRAQLPPPPPPPLRPARPLGLGGTRLDGQECSAPSPSPPILGHEVVKVFSLMQSLM